jgi:hypothetical protein
VADRTGKLTVIATILFAVPLIAAAVFVALWLRSETVRPDSSLVWQSSLCVSNNIGDSPAKIEFLGAAVPRSRGSLGQVCTDSGVVATDPARLSSVVLRDLDYPDWYLFAQANAVSYAYVPDASLWPFTDPDSIGIVVIQRDQRQYLPPEQSTRFKENDPGRYQALADLQRTLNQRILLLAGGTLLLIVLVAAGTRLALRRASRPAAAPAPHTGMGSVVGRLSEVSSDLVLLSRLDTESPDSFDLAVLAHQETARRYPPDLAYVVDLGDDPVPVRGNPELIEQLLANLLDNAERQANSTITLRLRTTPQFAVLEAIVDDSTPSGHRYSTETFPLR